MTNTHDKALAKAGTTFDDTVSRILETWNRATDSDIESGSRWYLLNGQAIVDMAYGFDVSVDTAAAVVAHLSPRLQWARNIVLAANVLGNGSTKGIMKQSLKNAQRALDSDAPLTTLRGNKVRNFAANLLGDAEAVTVDVWAARVAFGLGKGFKSTVGESETVKPETLLARKGVYDAIADAYREAAHRVGVEPSTMQATTWIVARNGRAD